jgi:release factor glutamine methyltransferase
VIVELGDLYEPISRLVDPRPFDLIVANPPYIPTNQLETLDKSVRDFEPIAALDGGIDGLIIHRHILQKAPEHLTAAGRVFLEIAFDQGPAALEMAAAHDAFEDARLLKDYGGRDRVLTLKRRAITPI